MHNKNKSRVDGIKTESTFYTKMKVENARLNISRYNWAKEISERAIESANSFVKLGLNFIWDLITAQDIPRAASINLEGGCPICGKECFNKGAYPFSFDCINTPWKIKCKNCNNVYPSNDFSVYYKSGLNDAGVFDPEIANRELLVNTMYPDKGKDWCVDDGYGWVDGNGTRNLFIAYYNHWAIWSVWGGHITEDSIVVRMLNTLKDAYLYTGEDKYASAGIVLLDRIADIYPDMNLDKYQYKDGYLNCWGITGRGKILGCIWEARLLKYILLAYDAFVPAMKTNKPSEIIPFLNRKSIQYPSLTKKNNMDDINKNIENNIIRQIFPSIKRAEVYGNVGMHQSTLALAALILDIPDESNKWIDWIYAPGNLEMEPEPHITGGNMHEVLASCIDRDGCGNEASIEYNYYWIIHLKMLADALEGFKGHPGADLYKHPKIKKMFSSYNNFVALERYMSNMGDSFKAGNPGIHINVIDKQCIVDGYGKYKDIELAQMVYFLNDNSASNLHLDIFEKDAGEIGADINNIINTYGLKEFNSVNMTGFGYSILRDGSTNIQNRKKDTARDIWITYGRTIWHAHHDSLNIGIHAFGLDLSPDMGYPESASSYCAHRTEWSINTIAHNTVVVDNQKQARLFVGLPHNYLDTKYFKLIDVSAPPAYPQTKIYRRTAVMVRVDELNSYFIDFFKVEGGNDHHYSFHGAESNEVIVEGISLYKQNGGTYAGENIAYTERFDDLNNSPEVYRGSGFHYLYNVERGKPQSPFSVDWRIVDTWKVLEESENIHLKLTMLSEVNDIALADGQPPQNKPGNPEKLRFLIAHRIGENLNSLFTAVIQPYRDIPFIASAVKAEVKKDGIIVKDEYATAVKVTLANGRTDYIFQSSEDLISYTIDDRLVVKGRNAQFSLFNDTPLHAVLNAGTLLMYNGKILIDKPIGVVKGEIYNFTKGITENSEITIKANSIVNPKEMIGRFIYVFNSYHTEKAYEKEVISFVSGHTTEYVTIRNAVYEIKYALNNGEGEYLLSLGNSSFINGLVNTENVELGFTYDISNGDEIEIPLSYQWDKDIG